MSEMKTVQGILPIIKSISSNCETGRLDIDYAGTHGTLLFRKGRLIHASLGSLTGFQAVNAAVALRFVQYRFDPLTSISHSGSITGSERVVLRRFFGIEAAEMEEPFEHDIPPHNLEDTPKVIQLPVPPFAPARSKPNRKPIFAAICAAALVGLMIGVIAFRARLKAPQQTTSVTMLSKSEPRPVAVSEQSKPDTMTPDLSGEWRVINTVQKTGYKSYGNLQVGFRLSIDQNGKEFTAKGEKVSENGKTLPAARRTPINVTGSIDGDNVLATFVEDGRMRRTNGRFVWKLKNDGLAGTFESTAANSSGKSAVTKQ